MSDPDPRFSLANERTFLAWIRTALGLLAAGAGVVAVDPPWPDVAVRALATLMALTAGAAAFAGWNRWRKVEAAIAAGCPAPPLRAHVALAAVVTLVAIAVALLVVA